MKFKKASKPIKLCLKLGLVQMVGISLGGCQQNIQTLSSDFSVTHSVQSAELTLYWFKPHEFSLSSSASEAETLELARRRFSQDLKQAQIQGYRQPSDFSILLLAGSEGNHLLAGSEGNHLSDLSVPPVQIARAENTEVLEEYATLAQLVILEPQGTAQIFKGSFNAGQFEFSGDLPQMTELSQTYLLAIDGQGEIDSFSGSLASVQNSQSSSSKTDETSKSKRLKPPPFFRPPPPPPGFVPFDYPGFAPNGFKHPSPDRDRLRRALKYMRSISAQRKPSLPSPEPSSEE